MSVSQNQNKTKHSIFNTQNSDERISTKKTPFSTENSNSRITLCYLNNYLIITRDRGRGCVQLSGFVSLHWCGCLRLDISYYL